MTTLTVQELEAVKTYVLRELPRVLEQDPQFVTLVESIVNEKFPRRDEFARLLDEMTAMRKESSQRSDQTNERFDKVDERFDKADERFDKADERFDKVDERFDKVDERFDKVDERFEKVDERFEKVDERFEKVDERFDKVDERFDKVDERFDKVDEWRAKADADFLQLRREGIQTRARFDRIDRRMAGQDAWMQLYSGRLGSDKGQNLEDTFALALRYGLRNPDLSPDDIHLRVKLVDREGLVYPSGAVTEVDVVIQGQRWTVFEIKAAAAAGDVDSFALKLKLLHLQQTDKEIRGVFFSCIEDKDLQQRCRAYQIELIEPFATLPQGPPSEEEIDAIFMREVVEGIPPEELE
jgi:hypothetical protein